MSERRIGKVISVDSFRVFIKLDEDLKSLYKSGYEDIYEVARINSYIIIPIGPDKIVAMITRVKAIDETELSKDKEAIFLTDSARYLVATMIGTIEGDKKYIQGVYNYPVLDNPVWYVTKTDLDNIFDQKEKTIIDFSNDYYLPIGSSPSFSDYKIKINPDRFFGKHAAILGNTGSGKSCTLTSIVHSLFEFSYNSKNLKNAHIIIFDTNGEYKQAFHGNSEKVIAPFKKLELVNPFHIDKKGMKVPYWFMNFDDFDYLFDPSAGTQAPILKRAIALSKGDELSIIVNEIPPTYILWIHSLLNFTENIDDYWKIDNFKIPEYLNYFNELDLGEYSIQALKDAIQKLLEIKPANYDKVDIKELEAAKSKIKNELAKYESYLQEMKSTQEQNIDLPIWFPFKKLINKDIDNAIDELESSSNRIREFVSTLRLRLQSYLNDERIAEPLLLKQKEKITDSLAKFLAFVLGDFCKIYKEADDDTFTNYYKKFLSEENNEKLKVDEISQITIIDMSLLPYEVLETITGLIGRLILDFVSRFPEKDRGKMPIVIALEEAQNYIPEKNKKDKESISKKVFERIAREGRKYGISLLVSSQRPFELSKTVLSQCNSFIIHRLQNPEDQKYVRQLVSSANEDILQQLPILPQQHAIIMGDAVRTPVQVKIRTVTPTPNSNDPKFIENWLSEKEDEFPDYKAITEAWRKGEKYEGENKQIENNDD